jgi:predicted transcriptional regulator
MGNLRKLKRNLKEKNVWFAKEVEKQRIELVKKMLIERVEKDAKFAEELMKAIGENLPPEIKEAAMKALEPKVEEQVSKEPVPEAIKVEDLLPTISPQTV